jgi:hypothetical protein
MGDFLETRYQEEFLSRLLALVGAGPGEVGKCQGTLLVLTVDRGPGACLWA